MIHSHPVIRKRDPLNIFYMSHSKRIRDIPLDKGIEDNGALGSKCSVTLPFPHFTRIYYISS